MSQPSDIVPYGPQLPTCVAEWELYVEMKRSLEIQAELLYRTRMAAGEMKKMETDLKLQLKSATDRKRKHDEMYVEVSKQVRTSMKALDQMERRWR